MPPLVKIFRATRAATGAEPLDSVLHPAGTARLRRRHGCLPHVKSCQCEPLLGQHVPAWGAEQLPFLPCRLPPAPFLSMCSIAAEAAHWGRCPLCPPWQIDSSWSPRALRDARPLTCDPERALCERTHNCSCVRVVGGGGGVPLHPSPAYNRFRIGNGAFLSSLLLSDF